MLHFTVELGTAVSAGFQIIGLAGILLLAKQLRFIPSVKSLLDELRNKNFRLSDEIYKEILKRLEKDERLF